MNKTGYTLIALFHVVLCLHAQERLYPDDSLERLVKCGLYKAMTSADSAALMNLPVLALPEQYKGPSAPLLPATLDNSKKPFMRPVFQQTGLCCGQAALVGYNFTYEMNWKRDVPGYLAENQYPTHYVYNWASEGNNYGGVSYYHSMEVLRSTGTPNVAEYGGMAAGGGTRWMSGYEDYYNAMHNRLENGYNIRTDTYEGFMTLKYWLYDHLTGSPAGGVANFYANQPPIYYLPPGTPEAGKCVCIGWASYSSHALTIVGWNDSIRWDYNNDGQYTNNIDINGDGNVDMKDWEIGGFKFVNSYGGVPAWGDSGYCYMMYKTVADKFGEGGIWNNTVNVLKVKEDDQPQLTMKVKIQYTCREQLKIYAGVAENTSASRPTHILNLPVFDYQGGCLYMQGGTTEEDKTMEFGIDITPLLNYISSGQSGKYFLVVVENDPNNTASGYIKNFSLMDYTDGITEIPYGSSNIPINENDTTFLSITTSVNYDDVTVTTSSLPQAVIYEPYSCQLAASGGTSPYLWSIDMGYTETSQNGTFPDITDETLTPNSNTDGYAIKALPFEFPFYGKLYDTVYMYVDGFLKFDNWLVTWPYFQEIYYRFTKNRNIAPFFDVNLTLYPGGGDGLWYEGDETGATFRWRVSQNGYSSQSDLNLAVKLYPSGKIEFYYGDVILATGTRWFGGTSNGDGKNYQLSAVSNATSIPDNLVVEFTPKSYPIEMALSADGLFSGTPVHEYNATNISFVATDQNMITSSAMLPFTTTGIMSDFTVHAGDDAIIDQGDTVRLDAAVKNITGWIIHNAVMTVTTEDDYVHMSDSTLSIGAINPGQSLNFPNAFQFEISDTVPNNHVIPLSSLITATEGSYTHDIELVAYAPLVHLGTVTFSDGNDDILEPGETGELQVMTQNLGKGKATGIHSVLSSLDPQIVINDGEDSIAVIEGLSSETLTFNITAASSTMEGHVAYFDIVLTGDNGITISDSLYLTVGMILEDFETGDFSKFPWTFSGSQPWCIDFTNPYEGSYCARSGLITDQQMSIMKMSDNVLSNSTISFYRRASSEPNYDFLLFYIDGPEKGRWSGVVPWGSVFYPVTRGYHTFKWEYSKDVSVSSNEDRVMVDYIAFPPLESWLLTVYAGPDDTICENDVYSLNGSASHEVSILWETTGSGVFSNDTILNPDYTPGLSDIITGAVVLKLTAYHSRGFSLTDCITLFIHRLPVADAGQEMTTCEYEPVTLNGSVTNANSSLWITAGDGIFSDPTQPVTTYYPGTNDVEAEIISLYLMAYPQAPCSTGDSDTMHLFIVKQPSVDAGPDGMVCEGQSYPLSGEANYASTVLWSSGGDGTFSDPSSLTAVYTPGPGDISSGAVVLTLTADAICPCTEQDQDDMTLSIQPPPEADAGENQTIPYMTSTTLYGSATGGSGTYAFHWAPENRLVDPDLQNPTTVPLNSTTTFTLTVTDDATGCISTDHTTVYIEGSPFEITVTADPDNICLGESSQLNVTVTGDTEPYVFAWTSDPPGFTSDLPNPMVTPLMTTTYFVLVTDVNNNPVEGSVMVTVTPPPVAGAGDDTITCGNVSFTCSGTASSFISIAWITQGDGDFDDNTILDATYTPGVQDVLNGYVTLSLTAYAIAPCDEPFSDTMLLSFFPVTVVTFDSLPEFCLTDPPYLFTEGNPPGGTYSGDGVVDGYFYPALAGTGLHTITYTFTDDNACTYSESRTALVDPCTGWQEQKEDLSVIILPNPNNGSFILLIKAGASGPCQITIHVLPGMTIYRETFELKNGENRIPLSLGSKFSGLYLMIIETNKTAILKKIIIQH